ncbi:hypothetical protein N7456_005813 [Penicillium angulare]|uniref:Uncharacterized protein n=1 Tax=Penicillium angulare TaxID=116970 RepID=A0A9W9KKV8_9EURO|nr:hypothetical protein N7456_005813 [Penicillium angulare]
MFVPALRPHDKTGYWWMCHAMRGADTWPVQRAANRWVTANGEDRDELQAPIFRNRKEEPGSMGDRGGFGEGSEG